MISVVLNCSSPFVGYAEKAVDWQKNDMAEVSSKVLTEEGMKFFNVSGSKYLLADFGTRKYFHARNMGAKAFDEQNRRIYTNIAFIGETKEDAGAINQLAAYAILKEQEFYTEFARLIVLEKLGYTVKFQEMKEFLAKFYQKNRFSAGTAGGQKLLSAIFSEGQTRMKLIVFEADWDYFVRQSEMPGLKHAVLELGNEELKQLVAKSKAVIRWEGQTEKKDRISEQESGERLMNSEVRQQEIVREVRQEDHQPIQPQTEQPQTEQPQTDQLQTDQPQTEQPQAEQPQTDQSQAEQPQAEQPQTDQPQTEQPRTEQSQTDQPQTDQLQVSDEPEQAGGGNEQLQLLENVSRKCGNMDSRLTVLNQELEQIKQQLSNLKEKWKKERFLLGALFIITFAIDLLLLAHNFF
ncbi:MAG: hypothetical protein LUG93_17520 [Lachnospiraceae bacterium]|nr:hypothetical protein [Lachnospiraceae bacterium]